jgi:pyruvate dehydrogenase complex dehydrogenase (E1) component
MLARCFSAQYGKLALSRTFNSTTKDSIRSTIRQTISQLENDKTATTTQQDSNLTDTVSAEDKEIHPDWLSLERRLKARRSKPRSKTRFHLFA